MILYDRSEIYWMVSKAVAVGIAVGFVLGFVITYWLGSL